MSIQLLVGDCRTRLGTLPANSVDCVIADPPYGETSLEWDRTVRGWLPAMRRVLKPNASLWCFGSLRFFMAHPDEFVGWRLAQDIVWEKHNGSSPSSDRFRRVHEMAAHFYPADSPWAAIYKCPVYTNDATARSVHRKQRPSQWGEIGEATYTSEEGGPRLMRSVFYARSCHGNAIHPTQKPVEILLPLIEFSCPPNGTLLDPFAGSGTTGIAAKATNRSAILIEINPRFAEAARRRLDQDAPLFAATETTQ